VNYTNYPWVANLPVQDWYAKVRKDGVPRPDDLVSCRRAFLLCRRYDSKCAPVKRPERREKFCILDLNDRENHTTQGNVETVIIYLSLLKLLFIIGRCAFTIAKYHGRGSWSKTSAEKVRRFVV